MKKGYVVLDTETTGFRYDDDVIQFSGIILDQNLSIKAYVDKYVYTSKKIPMDATRVHGITNDKLEKLSDRKSIENYSKTLVSLLKDYVVIGHNVEFDIRMIVDNLERHCGIKVSKDSIERIDTMKRYTEHLALPNTSGKGGKYKYPKLIELSQHCINKRGDTMEGVSNKYKKVFKKEDSLHDSLFDCFLTYYSFMTLR